MEENLMEETIIQSNGGITINSDVSIKNSMHVEKIIFRILLHAAVKWEKI